MHIIPELLAPAGSPETLGAGLEAGADAFYCGAPDFNARKRAKNFTNEELEQAAAFVHQHGKKLYVTLNTLVFDREMEQLTDLLLVLDRAAVDAVIVQDLGVLHLIRAHFPKLRIHASTQTFCHNSLQAQFLRDAGVSRIVLPRELSLNEIAAIQEKVPLEYEIFCHGALCFSFSGCCNFSSYYFKNSGNRGECRQACRFKFGTEENGNYPFSMKDLNTAPLLEKILKLKPAALKIEGRQKNADYVIKTVGMYRHLLDVYAEKGYVNKPDEPLRGQRVFTSGYFEVGPEYSKLVNTADQGSLGEEIGRGFIKEAGVITISTKAPIQKGVRLRLVDSRGRMAIEGTILAFKTREREKRQYEITWSFRDARVSDEAYKVMLMGTYQPPDPRKQFRHAQSKEKSTSVSLTLTWKENKLTILARPAEQEADIRWSGTLALEKAKSASGQHALAEAIRKVFSETGGHTFSIKTINVFLPEGMFCPPSRIKEIRREVFDVIQRELGEGRKLYEKTLRKEILDDLASIQKESRGPNRDTLSSAHDVTELHFFGDKAGAPERFIMLPLFIPENKIEAWMEKINILGENGHTRFIAPTYGLIPLLSAAGAEVLSGPYVYCVNSFAYRYLIRMGAVACVLPPDLSDGMLDPVASFKNTLRINNPEKEMFVTRLKIPKKDYMLRGKNYSARVYEDYSVLTEDAEDLNRVSSP